MNTNSTIKVDWNDKTFEVRAQWQNNYFIDDSGLAEDIYFSEKYESEWDTGHFPKFTVLHDDGQTSDVQFEEMTGEFFSLKPCLPVVYHNQVNE